MRFALLVLFTAHVALAQQGAATATTARQEWPAPQAQAGSEMDAHIAASATLLGLGSASLLASAITFFALELSCIFSCRPRDHTPTIALAIGGGSAAAIGLIWLVVAVAIQNAERAEEEVVWRVGGGFDSNGGWLALNRVF